MNAASPELLASLKRNRAALDLIDPARVLQYAITMDLMRKDMDAAIAIGAIQVNTSPERVSETASPLTDPADHYPAYEALSQLVHLIDEEDALNGGGPNWRARYDAALSEARELVRIEP